MTKQQVISMLIIEELNKGKSVKEAMDSVLGEGTYLTLANDLYDTINNK